MLAARTLLVTAILVLAVTVQVAVFGLLRLPGASPDVLVLAVLGVALRWGPIEGALTGFFGGLLLDAAPPADATLGRWALVVTLIGYFAGKAWLDVERSALLGPLVVLGGCAATVTGYAMTGVLLSDPRVDADRLFSAAPAALLYDLLLAPFVVWGVYRLAARLESAQT